MSQWIRAWLLKPINRKPTEFVPAIDEGTGILLGLLPAPGKPAFDDGLVTSGAGNCCWQRPKNQSFDISGRNSWTPPDLHRRGMWQIAESGQDRTPAWDCGAARRAGRVPGRLTHSWSSVILHRDGLGPIEPPTPQRRSASVYRRSQRCDCIAPGCRRGNR
jgi:hypothetical protein